MFIFPPFPHLNLNFASFYESRADEQSKIQSYGKPMVGGPFTLTNHLGETVSSESFKGKFMMIYFGFTNCPDICPDELDKMGNVLDLLTPLDSVSSRVEPIFITCDPSRDTPEVIKEYLAEFHPRMIGLTGPFKEVEKTAKSYRVYFSAPPPSGKSFDPDATDDYLVDHSIFIYFMDPSGEFLDAFGKNQSAEDVATQIRLRISDHDKMENLKQEKTR
jgi:protein SCO1